MSDGFGDVRNDVDAERWTLAGMMQSPQACADVVEILEPADFYRPQHADLYLGMVSMFACSEAMTPVTVADWMERDHGGMPKGIDRVYLFDLFQIPLVPGAASRHAAIVKECSVARRIAEVGHRLVQMAGQPGADMRDVLDAAQDQLGNAFRASADANGTTFTSLPVDAFIAIETMRAEPVIPGLVDHRDRVLVVGFEGDGKTTLAYQVAVATAAGVHPFAWTAIPPKRIMIIDLENPEAIIRRKLAKLVDVAQRHGTWDPANLEVASYPGGVDLTRPADRYRVAERIRLHRPDLVVAGPVYKMLVDEGQGAEQLHSQVTHFWDQVRQRYGCALWLETHAPGSQAGGKRLLRPAGWSGYLRWPEFGLGLERGAKGTWKLSRFRGDREEGRQWPETLERTRSAVPQWPWTARYPRDTFADPIDPAGYNEEAS